MEKGFTTTAGAKRAFTLAEVLITLAIIGVVAAMTVPALMTSTRGKEYETGANKAMSTLANSLQMRYAINGQEFSDFAARWRGIVADDMMMAAYLVVPADATFGPGAASPVLDINGNPTGMTMTTLNVVARGLVEEAALPVVEQIAGHADTFKLKDGMIIAFDNRARGAHITVDTNGVKGPSRLGVLSTSAAAGPCIRESPDGINVTNAAHDNITPATNACPDLVQFRIEGDRIIPLNQRTLNILATGNAMIAQ